MTKLASNKKKTLFISKSNLKCNEGTNGKILLDHTFVWYWKSVHVGKQIRSTCNDLNTLNAELNPICCLQALLEAHHFLHVSRIRVKSLTLRLLMSYIYIYIYGAPIIDVSRSHTTTQHSRYDSSGWVISSSQRPLPDKTQHSQQTNIHAPGGIRTHDLSWRAAADLRLRPRGYWDRLQWLRISNAKENEMPNSVCVLACRSVHLTLRLLMSYIYIYIYIWSTYSWCF